MIHYKIPDREKLKLLFKRFVSMASVVSLPIYADFGHFAYWPAPQSSVSKKVANKMSKIGKWTCDIETGF